MEKTDLKSVRKNFSENLKNDVFSVCGGLYSLNATHAIGYLFNSYMNKGKKEVFCGMFCNDDNDIDNSWEYYFRFSDKTFYEIV